MEENAFKKHVYVVILCGGGGTRVWPLSVSKKPKQFIKFYSDKTLFQETVAKALKITDITKIVIITNDKYVDEIKEEVPELPLENIIGEPIKRNTALAMGVAAAFVYNQDPNGVIINYASDHVVADEKESIRTSNIGASIAWNEHKLIAIGIKPRFAHPGLGYIEKGPGIKTVEGLPLSKVIHFKEKPTVEIAQKFIDSGNYYWNANNYIWRADDILESFDKLSPGIAKFIRLMQPNLGETDQNKALHEYYPQSPEEAIDTAISEKTDNLFVIPGDFGWNDIGGWQVVYELGKKDTQENVVINSENSNRNVPVILQDSSQNLVYAGKQPIALLGVKDIVVIDTGMGLLVCDRNKSNDVKKIVERLQSEGFTDYI